MYLKNFNCTCSTFECNLVLALQTMRVFVGILLFNMYSEIEIYIAL